MTTDSGNLIPILAKPILMRINSTQADGMSTVHEDTMPPLDVPQVRSTHIPLWFSHTSPTDYLHTG